MDKLSLGRREIASELLKIGAVFLRPDEPFTWASGIKSPVYCDNRLILTAPEVRERVASSIAAAVRAEFPSCELLMGTATAGIAHAAIAAHILGLPMGYVRSGAKAHGRTNRIEGKLVPGQKTLVIEDLVSTGGSVIEAAEALREAGAEVIGALCIFTYSMNAAAENMNRARLRLLSLTDFDVLTQTAAETGYIGPDDVARLRAFRDEPSDSSWMKR